jgi:hypothetical protein
MPHVRFAACALVALLAVAPAATAAPEGWELAFINAHGPRVQESGLGLIPGHAYSAPYEDAKLKAK